MCPNCERIRLRFGQMPDGAGALSPALVKQAEDHLGATDVMAIDVKLRVAPNLGNKRSQSKNAQPIKS